jgi:hypothetical protein
MLHAEIADLPTSEITADKLMPTLQRIWRTNFIDDDAELALRSPALRALAEQVARFFGPEAQPHTRKKPGEGANG